MKNKIISLVLSFALILSICAISSPVAFALNYKTETIDMFNGSEVSKAASVAFVPQKYPDALYNDMYNAVVECNENIDISQYSVSVDDIGWVYSSLYNNYPELFYLGQQFSYAYYSDGTVAYMLPEYKYTGDALDDVIDDYNNRLDVIANHFSALSDIEAVVAVNDYLAAHYEYDADGLATDPANAVRDAYSMLLKRKAVCQGYALLFTAIVEKLNIESASVVSLSMNHQWNVVKLDGYWYHIDVTWDDPEGVPDGYTYHDYMLHSDEAMSERLNHYDWVRIDNKTDTCFDTTYDDWAWTETNTQLTPHNGKWYYTKNTASGIDIVEISREGTRVVYTQEVLWNVWGEPGYAYTNSLATATWDKNWMLYHTQDKLYCYDTILNKVFLLTELDTSLGYVYYLHIDDDMLEYVVSESPNDFTNATHLQLDMSDIHYSSDVNRDGVCSAADISELTNILLERHVSELKHHSDVNNNGEINTEDLLLLQQIHLGLASPSVMYND